MNELCKCDKPEVFMDTECKRACSICMCPINEDQIKTQQFVYIKKESSTYRMDTDW